MLKHIAASIAYYSGIPFLIRELLQRKKVTIILYHDIDAELFKKHIAELSRRYNIIGLQDYMCTRRDPSIFKLPKKPLIITFDDGHKNNYNLLPVIKKYNIPVTIFLCSSIVDTNRHYWFIRSYKEIPFRNFRKMSDEKRIETLREQGFEENKEFETRHALNKDELLEMSEYVDFQSHTKYHPILPSCSNFRAEAEICGSKAELEEKFGLRVNSLSYPNGDYSQRDINLTKQAEYEAGITVDLGFNSVDTDSYRLKRICVDDGAGIYVLLLQVCGLWSLFKNLFAKKEFGYIKSYQD